MCNTQYSVTVWGRYIVVVLQYSLTNTSRFSQKNVTFYSASGFSEHVDDVSITAPPLAPTLCRHIRKRGVKSSRIPLCFIWVHFHPVPFFRWHTQRSRAESCKSFMQSHRCLFIQLTLKIILLYCIIIKQVIKIYTHSRTHTHTYIHLGLYPHTYIYIAIVTAFCFLSIQSYPATGRFSPCEPLPLSTPRTPRARSIFQDDSCSSCFCSLQYSLSISLLGHIILM